MEKKLRRYKIWRNMFVIIGFLGILDSLITGTLIEISAIKSSRFGIASIYIANGTAVLFGEGIAGLMALLFNFIMDASLLWFIIALIVHMKYKKLSKTAQSESI